MFFTSNHSVLYSTAVCSRSKNNLIIIIFFSFDLRSYFFVKGLYFALYSAVDGDEAFIYWLGVSFSWTPDMSLLFPRFCDILMTVMTWCAFFFFFTGIGAFRVYTQLWSYTSPTIKHQHEAISQCNRFVSSPSRSPGGPISGPSGPWRWFREKRGGRQKTRCDGKLLIHLLIKGHFLSAIRGWRLAYLGLDFCFISPPASPPALPFVSHRPVVKNTNSLWGRCQGNITS